jgi:hypothetical protein
VKQNGYFTVEAAFILPIVLWIYLFLIYQMLFQYNRCLMEQDMGTIALRGSLKTENNQVLLTELQDIYGTINQNKYVMFAPKKPHFIVSGDSITVEGDGSLLASLPPVINPEIPDGLWHAEVIYKNNRLNPVLFIRTCQKVTKAWRSF